MRRGLGRASRSKWRLRSREWLPRLSNNSLVLRVRSLLLYLCRSASLELTRAVLRSLSARSSKQPDPPLFKLWLKSTVGPSPTMKLNSPRTIPTRPLHPSPTRRSQLIVSRFALYSIPALLNHKVVQQSSLASLEGLKHEEYEEQRVVTTKGDGKALQELRPIRSRGE